MFGDFTFIHTLGRETFDMSITHGRYKRKAIEKLLDSRNVTLITLLRDPVEQFQSMWLYFGMTRVWEGNITEFVWRYL